MNAEDTVWHVCLVHPPFPWGRLTMRPADVTGRLRGVMFERHNSLEDAQYTRVVPNHYVVEVSEANYLRNYQPIERQIARQWSEKLLEDLNVANNRQGRRQYRFSGRVQVDIRSGKDLLDSQARILCRIEPGLDTSPFLPVAASTPCLMLFPNGRRWPLHSGTIVIGRDPSCDIYLDDPVVQETRLVSGHHAYLRYENGQVHLYDGSPEGKPSLNGTYVNNRRVEGGGALLQEGDLILLAALSPDQPRLETPGVAAFRFLKDCA